MQLTTEQFEKLIKDLANTTSEERRLLLLDAGVKVSWEKNKWYPRSAFNINCVPKRHEILLKDNNVNMEDECKYTIGIRGPWDELIMQEEDMDWTHFMILE